MLFAKPAATSVKSTRSALRPASARPLEPGETDSDLVFRPSEAIRGGRGTPFRSGHMRQNIERGAPEYRWQSANQFQARYAILHRWQGALACEEPIRGRWNGRAPRRRRRVHAAIGSADTPIRLRAFMRSRPAALFERRRRRRP